VFTLFSFRSCVNDIEQEDVSRPRLHYSIKESGVNCRIWLYSSLFNRDKNSTKSPGSGRILFAGLKLSFEICGGSIEGAQVVPSVLEEVSALTARLFDPRRGHRE